MYRAVMKVAKQKPLIVSFGNIAASGGYYLAAGAPRIVATPPTVTGSIGIFTGKIDISELYRKVGISTHTERTLPQADAMGMHRPWTEAEVKRARVRLKAYYDKFVNIVAAGRKLNKEAAYERAQGRVYDGDKALSLKLVDAHAGLWDAIQWVRKEAGADSEPYSISYLPTHDSFIKDLLQFFGASTATSALTKSTKRSPSILERLAIALFGLKQAGVYAQMPYVLEIK
jgi:protease-4